MNRRPFVPSGGGGRGIPHGMGQGPQSLPLEGPYRDLPPDLWPRTARLGELQPGGPAGVSYGEPTKMDRNESPPFMGNAIYLTRNLNGRTVTITTTPTLLVDSSYAWPYLILNPSKTVGLTTTVTGFSGTVVAAGNTQASPIGVSGFYAAHYHLNVTAVTGTWDLVAQSYDSISLQWMDTQTIFAGVAATGQYYASVGTLGIATDLTFRWNPTAAGSLTFSLAAVLKGGLGGSSAGLANVAYLGGPGVSTVSGYPLLESQQQQFIIGQGVQLWGVAAVSIDVRIFML